MKRPSTGTLVVVALIGVACVAAVGALALGVGRGRASLRADPVRLAAARDERSGAQLVVEGGSGPPRPQQPVSLKDIHDRGVEGRLGARLGTIVEVTGEIVANTSRSKVDAGEPFFLKIMAVNGGALATPVQYPFVKQNRWLEVSPSIGEKFRYVGDETGRFDGSPDGEFEYVPAYTTTGFGFVTTFVVLAAK